MDLEFIDTQKRLPAYGLPCLIIANGVIQNITYCLDGSDDVPDWFEPYFFEHDDNLKINWDKVQKWCYVPERI